MWARRLRRSSALKPHAPYPVRLWALVVERRPLRPRPRIGTPAQRSGRPNPFQQRSGGRRPRGRPTVGPRARRQPAGHRRSVRVQHGSHLPSTATCSRNPRRSKKNTTSSSPPVPVWSCTWASTANIPSWPTTTFFMPKTPGNISTPCSMSKNSPKTPRSTWWPPPSPTRLKPPPVAK